MRVAGIFVGFGVVLVAFAASIAFGKAAIPLATVWNALWYFDGSQEHLLIRTVRFPRALIATAVGACLATAGAIMQGITRNPLAGPELFGVNQGASLAVVVYIFLLDGESLFGHLAYALVGAGLSGGLTYVLGSLGRQGLTPVKLILAGSAINLFFASLIQGVLVMDERSLDTMRFWLAGALTGRDISLFMNVLPLMVLGLICAIVLGRQVNLISLGEETARGLGQRLVLVQLGALLAVILLAGASVAIAGPIGFIGLAVPHVARALVGSDYRWILPYSAILGALLLLLADILARFVWPAQEISAGIVTAVLGAPFLIYLAQKRG
ncbi:iron ABC transporter permease [Anoxybacillus sp. UARK-01]|uniref:FecCD family ABC transporter permease n=1 Tax=Anoxybacillus sp. UARK-01 TaxID=1895648 RepID=UPI00191BB3E6|nr:iron ABC transporter permease [Anoxybacillus sp. UARK-01]